MCHRWKPIQVCDGLMMTIFKALSSFFYYFNTFCSYQWDTVSSECSLMLKILYTHTFPPNLRPFVAKGWLVAHEEHQSTHGRETESRGSKQTRSSMRLSVCQADCSSSETHTRVCMYMRLFNFLFTFTVPSKAALLGWRMGRKKV